MTDFSTIEEGDTLHFEGCGMNLTYEVRLSPIPRCVLVICATEQDTIPVDIPVDMIPSLEEFATQKLRSLLSNTVDN